MNETYVTSKDYERLWKLVTEQKHKILANGRMWASYYKAINVFCDMHGTVYFDGGHVVRNFILEEKSAFIDLCIYHKLEFIDPASQQEQPQKLDCIPGMTLDRNAN